MLQLMKTAVVANRLGTVLEPLSLHGKQIEHSLHLEHPKIENLDAAIISRYLKALQDHYLKYLYYKDTYIAKTIN